VHTELEEDSEEDLAKCFEYFKPMEQDYILNESFVKNPNTAVLGYNPKDEQGLCYLYMKTGHCNRKFCTKEHKKLNEGKKCTMVIFFFFYLCVNCKWRSGKNIFCVLNTLTVDS
jgi:hypothetical protein